jgi:YVTN family beta-propeller protein
MRVARTVPPPSISTAPRATPWSAVVAASVTARLPDTTLPVMVSGFSLTPMAALIATGSPFRSVARTELFVTWVFSMVTGVAYFCTGATCTPAAFAFWSSSFPPVRLGRVDSVSGRATGRVRVGNGPVALAAQAGSLWVANSLDATVSRVDPATLAVTSTVPVGSGPAALAAGSGSVWVASRYAGTVSRIDPGRNRVAASFPVGGAPTSLGNYQYNPVWGFLADQSWVR